MKDILIKLKKIDTVSKIFLVAIILLIAYIGYLQVKNLIKKSSPSEIIEVSKDKSITLDDYFFEFYQRNRQANDRKLYIKTNEALNQDKLNKLEFRLTPRQDFSVNLKSENLIEINFNQESPADLKENTLIVLEQGKQIFRIVYKNLRIEDSRADEVFIDQ